MAIVPFITEHIKIKGKETLKYYVNPVTGSDDNDGTPGTSNGNKMTTSNIVFTLAANEVVYFGSSFITDKVNWTTKVL